MRPWPNVFHFQFICSIQCDQIGRFFKVLGGRLSYYVRWLQGHFENITFEVKTAVVTFLGNFIKNWATFNSLCGQAGSISQLTNEFTRQKEATIIN